MSDTPIPVVRACTEAEIRARVAANIADLVEASGLTIDQIAALCWPSYEPRARRRKIRRWLPGAKVVRPAKVMGAAIEGPAIPTPAALALFCAAVGCDASDAMGPGWPTPHGAPRGDRRTAGDRRPRRASPRRTYVVLMNVRRLKTSCRTHLRQRGRRGAHACECETGMQPVDRNAENPCFGRTGRLASRVGWGMHRALITLLALAPACLPEDVPEEFRGLAQGPGDLDLDLVTAQAHGYTLAHLGTPIDVEAELGEAVEQGLFPYFWGDLCTELLVRHAWLLGKASAYNELINDGFGTDEINRRFRATMRAVSAVALTILESDC